MLEGAMIGLPTILVPLYNEACCDNKYYRLNELHDYIGGFYPEKTNLITEHKGMDVILYEVYNLGLKKELGDLCKNYVIKNHSIDTTVCKLLLSFLQAKPQAIEKKLFKQSIKNMVKTILTILSKIPVIGNILKIETIKRLIRRK